MESIFNSIAVLVIISRKREVYSFCCCPCDTMLRKCLKNKLMTRPTKEVYAVKPDTGTAAHLHADLHSDALQLRSSAVFNDF